MDRTRTMNEILALQDQFPVAYSLDRGVVKVDEVQFPEGWQPRTGHILYELSDIYPKTPPWTYLPEEVTYTKGFALHHLSSDKDGYNKWCIEGLDWNPQRHTLVTMTKLVLASMEHPNKANPFTDQ